MATIEVGSTNVRVTVFSPRLCVPGTYKTFHLKAGDNRRIVCKERNSSNFRTQSYIIPKKNVTITKEEGRIIIRGKDQATRDLISFLITNREIA